MRAIVARVLSCGVGIGAIPLVLAAQPALDVAQRLSTTNATVGDKVAYVLTVSYPEGAVLMPLPDAGLPAEVAVTKFLKTKSIKNGRVTEQFTAELIPFSIGRFVIPTRSVRVRVEGAVTTIQAPALSVLVRSVLATQDRQLADLKRATSPPLPIGIWVLGLGTVVAIVGGPLVWLLGKRRRTSPIVPVRESIPDSPYPQFLADVLVWRGDVLALSHIMRRFLVYRFDCPALALTTREIVATLTPLMSPDDLAAMTHVLNWCDRVKFARYVPTEKEIRLVGQKAHALLLAYPDSSEGSAQ